MIKLYVHALQDGSTTLHLAAFNGHIKTIEILMDAGATVDIMDNVS